MAIGHLSPVQALKDWQEKRPELFKKKVYNLTGLDTPVVPDDDSQVHRLASIDDAIVVIVRIDVGGIEQPVFQVRQLELWHLDQGSQGVS